MVLENKTGRILAMVGGFSYPLSQLNRATQSRRQPGSSFKPMSYLAALAAGLQPNTLADDGPITLPPYTSLTIAGDGTISIIPQGGDAANPQVVDRLKIVDTKGSQTVKGLDNLLRVKGGGTLPANLDAKVQGGALEGSNVNMTQVLVDMLENQRSYEIQANLMKSAKELDEGGSSVMRLPS